MSESPLSGVAVAPAIALCPGEPRLSVDATNRLLLRHGLNRALARAMVHDAVAAVMPLRPEEELPLIAAKVQALGLRSEAELAPWLAEQRWSRDDLRAMATLAERLRRWSHWRFEHEVEIRYLDRKADLDRVVYALLQVAERELAEELHQRLRRGEMSFAAAVEQFSLGTERDTQGLLGPVAVSATPAEIGSRLRVSCEGQLWAPFALAERWIVLRLERHRPAQLDQATRDQLLHELFAAWVDSQVEGLLQGEPLAAVPRPEPAMAS
jgi:parvulin-like peptidyl-prolyl isomerase